MSVSFKRIYNIILSSSGVIVNDNDGTVCYPDDICSNSNSINIKDYEGKHPDVLLTDKMTYDIVDGSVMANTDKGVISLTVMKPKKLRS